MNARHAIPALAALLGCGCGDPEMLPRHGETVIVVDVDMPVPKVISRLRIDLYGEDGGWFESREIARPDPADWPASFSVYSDDEDRDRRVFVRLRAFPDGHLRDYLGERFWDWSQGFIQPPEPAAGAGPRLFDSGRDITPVAEPEPLVTVDRLLLVSMRPGELHQIEVTLRAACAGTMTLLSSEPGQGPRPGEAQTCVDGDKVRVAVADSSLGARDAPPTSQQGSLTRLCIGAGRDGAVCIPGGATILGSRELSLVPDRPPVPARIVVHAPFFMDADEVTVGRFRAALAAGFTPPTPPIANEGALGTTVSNATCTWSESDLGRESYPLSCVDWDTASAFCAFSGGMLPSEAQWEHAATLAGGRGRSRYPWGNGEPTCDRAVYGRVPLGGSPGVCQDWGSHPEPVDLAEGDLTPQGAHSLAGGLGEWQRDAYADYADPCWASSPNLEPICADDGATMRSMRGASWAAPPTILPSAVRLGADRGGRASFIGFRCVYPEAP